MPTAELLLNLPGAEVAARPWLYPSAAFGDTDISLRLKAAGHLDAAATPSLKAHWMRKLLSRCEDFRRDYHLQALLYDTCMAKTISAVAAVAAARQLAPDEAAAGMPQFEAYWHHETQKLEDICRQMSGFPNLFFTVAPAEWQFPLHWGVLGAEAEQQASLSEAQSVLTIHIHNYISAVLDECLFRQGSQMAACGLSEVLHYVYRFEFQSRGTLHVHAVAWVRFEAAPASLSGRSGDGGDSPLLRFLEEVFCCGAVDVQCGASEHCLLTYVAGYLAKASDALRFQKADRVAEADPEKLSRWRQVYRLLCKRAPLEQEMTMFFAGLPVVKASFTGERLYTPIPGSKAVNNSRHLYNAYQQRLCAPGHPEHAQTASADGSRICGVASTTQSDHTGAPSRNRRSAVQLQHTPPEREGRWCGEGLRPWLGLPL